nr:biotin--protein ligase isoform X2 [Ciona intestinalis]|eukprot:XP_018669443.2 biotin--protein ligase isoform X2 [Ciona intestinalis]
MKLFSSWKTMLNPFLYKDRTSSSVLNTVFKTQSDNVCKINPNVTQMKPPNILLYSPGKRHEVSDGAIKLLQLCLAKHSYTLYPISTTSFRKDPWIKNTHTVIVWGCESFFSDKDNQTHTSNLLKSFITSGGNILMFNYIPVSEPSPFHVEKLPIISGPLFIKQGEEKKVLEQKYFPSFVLKGNAKSIHEVIVDEKLLNVSMHHSTENTGKLSISTLPLLVGANDTATNPMVCSLLKQLLKSVGLNCCDDDVQVIVNQMQQKIAFLYSNTLQLQEEFLQSLQKIESFALIPYNNDITPESVQELTERSNKTTLVYTKEENVYNYSTKLSCSFNQDVYFNNLSTRSYGRIVVYGDVMTSTMSVFDGLTCTKLPPNLGAVAIAKQQTMGKGRSGNQWISPLGCAMFTIVVDIPMNSKLGQCLPFLQLITTTAAVKGVRSINKLQDVELRIKWPNDIYYGKHVKLGGVVVQSTMLNNMCYASIGCGINVSNSQPTMCVNKILRDEHSLQLQLTTEEVIARTITELENLIIDFQKNGAESFLKIYYKYWLHSMAEVEVIMDESNTKVECTVVGVDDYGFLRVRRHDTAEVTTLCPDGNSFDMMQNQILPKLKRKT